MISNKPRAATIKCLSECYFLTLQKSDYDQILGKLSEAALSRQIDFLKHMPQFRSWSRNALGKVTYYLKREEFRRG